VTTTPVKNGFATNFPKTFSSVRARRGACARAARSTIDVMLFYIVLAALFVAVLTLMPDLGPFWNRIVGVLLFAATMIAVMLRNRRD
jgi:hypothetical protein